MIRIFLFLIFILALAFGFSWIADNPGIVTLNWQGRDIRTSLMVVVVALGVFIALIMFVWGIFRGAISMPSVLSKYFANRRRDRGYNALSRGLIAAGTGDKDLARRLTKESGKLLSNEPLVELLDAQTCLLEGNRQAARGRFESMLENKETRLLGLRGLYLEAEREGAGEASRQYADEAAELAPSLAWAGSAKLRNLSKDGNWEGALATLESNRSAGLIDKETAIRQRAVLLTAKAMEEEPANPDAAVKLAKEATRLAPDLVPAAVIGATAYVRGNNLRRAAKMLEASWKISPHPELADAYVNLRLGDAASDRLKRAQNLAKMRANNPQGNMAIADAAIEAKDWATARGAMKSVLANNISERACLIMADIEEGQHGDAGRMRDWLSRAVRAPRDAKWTCEGYTSETWLPISPVSGEIDVFEWKVPVEQLQGPGDTIDIGDLAEPLKMATPSEPKPEPISANRNLVEDKNTNGENEDAGSGAVNEDDNVDQRVENENVEDANVVEIIPTGNSSAKSKKPTANAKKPGKANRNLTAAQSTRKTVFPLPRRPDDPGVG